MRPTTLLSTVSGAAIMAGLAANAVAADAVKPRIEEVVVTAQKRSTVASRTPLALSVISGATLQQQGITNVASLQNYAPSLVVANAAHGVLISVRGVTTTDLTSKGETDVAFNLDGIPIGRPEVQQLSFFDLDRVEILRGPQGTLYGKSSTGGVINLITAKPTNRLQASAAVEFGNYNTRRVEGMVNIPITDSFALRAAVNANYRDGFIHPVLNSTLKNADGSAAAPYSTRGGQPYDDEDNQASRITGRYLLPYDLGDITATGTFGHMGGQGSSGQMLYYSWLHDMAQQNPKVFYNPDEGTVHDNYQNYNGEVNLKLGPVHFTYDGGYQRFSADDNYSDGIADPAADGGTYTYQNYHAKITTVSHEIRFSNQNASRFEWVVGANYSREVIDERDDNWQNLVFDPTTGASCAPSIAPACNAPNPDIVGPTEHPSKGVFGSLTYAITPKLKITGGLRYSRDSTARQATVAAGQPPPGGFLDANGNPCHPGSSCVGPAGAVLRDYGFESSSKVTFKLGAQYQFTPTQLAYVSVSTGYKPGGFNDLNPLSPGNTAPYGPATLTSYEVGYKGRILPNLQFNTDVYYYDFSHYQLTGATFFTPNITGGAPVVLIYTTNPPATLFGWENDVRWAATDNDTFTGSFTLEQGYFNSGKNHATVGFLYNVPVDWSGKSLDNLPTASAILGYEHRFDLQNGGNITLRAHSQISSQYYETDYGGNGVPFPLPGFYTTLPAQYRQPTYTRSDFNLAYNAPDNRYTVEAFVRNIEGKLQLVGAPQNIYQGPSSASIRVTTPRFFGVRLSFRY